MSKHWYTLEDLSYHLDLSTDDIERLFIDGELIPSIHLPSTPLSLLDETGTKITERLEKHGTFDIRGFEKLKWRWSTGGYSGRHCDLYEQRIRLFQTGQIYGFTAKYSLTDREILITHENVKKYEAKNKAAESIDKKLGYMNLDHTCYAEELADAVRAWEYTVKQEATPKTFKAVAKKWLEERGYEGAALERLATIVNPDEGKRGGAPKREP